MCVREGRKVGGWLLFNLENKIRFSTSVAYDGPLVDGPLIRVSLCLTHTCSQANGTRLHPFTTITTALRHRQMSVPQRRRASSRA